MLILDESGSHRLVQRWPRKHDGEPVDVMGLRCRLLRQAVTWIEQREPETGINDDTSLLP